MSQTYQVKGSTIESKFKYVQEKFGPTALEDLESKLAQLDLLPLIASGWYPFETYISVLATITDLFLDYKLSRLEEAGAFSAKKALEGVYSSFAHKKDFAKFLARIAQLHKMFYSAGKLEVKLDENGKGCQLWHREKPAHHQADLYVAKGFYTEAARLHDLSQVHCDFTTEGQETHFKLKWA